MELHIVGSGSGMPVGHRSSSSFWLENNGDVILLDCGDGTSSALHRANLNPLEIGAIVFSHSHSDHWAGFPLLIQTFHLLRREKPLKVLASHRIVKFLKYVLEMSYMWSERIGFEIVWQPIEDGKKYKFKSFSIIPHLNSHLEGYRSDLFRHPLCDIKSFSFEILCDKTRGIYSADIGALSDIDELLHRKAKWLLIEGMHYSVDEFKKWITKKPVEKTIITHIPPEREKADFGNVIVAQDGMTIHI